MFQNNQVVQTLILTEVSLKDVFIFENWITLQQGDPQSEFHLFTTHISSLISSLVPPSFLNPETEYLEAPTPGTEISLNCTATGNPAPVYSWQTPQPLQGKMDEALLSFSSLLPGTYACTASNILEKKTKQFILKKNKGLIAFKAVTYLLSPLLTFILTCIYLFFLHRFSSGVWYNVIKKEFVTFMDKSTDGRSCFWREKNSTHIFMIITQS